MKQNIQIAPLDFSTTEAKLLKQIWREDYPDCASIEEVTRRLALKGISSALRMRATFNIFRKMRNAGQSWEEIAQTLEKRGLDWEAVKKQIQADVKPEAKTKPKDWKLLSNA